MEIELDNLIHKHILIDPSCKDFIVDDFPKENININIKKKKRKIKPELISFKKQKPKKIIIKPNPKIVINNNDTIIKNHYLKRQNWIKNNPKKRLITPTLIER